VASIR